MRPFANFVLLLLFLSSLSMFSCDNDISSKAEETMAMQDNHHKLPFTVPAEALKLENYQFESRGGTEGCCTSEAYCSNNMSVILAGLTDNSKICLYESYIEYCTVSGATQRAKLNRSLPVGYTAYLPFNTICQGSEITATLCRVPIDTLEVCTDSCYNWTVYITAQGQGTGGPYSKDLCLNLMDSCQTVSLGHFNCCVAGTISSCDFVINSADNFGAEYCDDCDPN